ncbi:MAG: hypothetical protein U0531_02000 [Dehalococcoidia bacterium]
MAPLALFLSGFGLVSVLSVVWWAISVSAVERAPTEVPFTIPQGTSLSVQAGATPSWLPADLTFVQGDTLTLRNDDTATHQLGAVTIPAGGFATLRLDSAGSEFFLCSIHPDGEIGLTVQPRPPLRDTLTPILLFGLPVGFVCGAVGFVLGRISLD